MFPCWGWSNTWSSVGKFHNLGPQRWTECLLLYQHWNADWRMSIIRPIRIHGFMFESQKIEASTIRNHSSFYSIQFLQDHSSLQERLVFTYRFCDRWALEVQPHSSVVCDCHAHLYGHSDVGVDLLNGKNMFNVIYGYWIPIDIPPTVPMQMTCFGHVWWRKFREYLCEMFFFSVARSQGCSRPCVLKNRSF